MAYKALLTKVTTIRDHPNADKLKLAVVNGYQVIVGKDIHPDQLVVFFEAGGQLSEDFAKANNLYRDPTLNQDKTALPGMFDTNRRVRSIRLRGEMSDGYVVPLAYFDRLKKGLTGKLESMELGTTFDELDGLEICRKYQSPQQLRAVANANKSGRRVPRGELPMFPKHFDTSPFARESYRIKPEGMAYITEKLHGTSHRIGHVKDEVPLWETQKGIVRWFNKIFNKSVTTQVWRIVHGTRNVVIDSQDEYKTRNSFYGTDAFRDDATKHVAPKRGEVIYGEIIGYVNDTTPIMAVQSTEVIKKEKDLIQGLPEAIVYNYGCAPGTCKFYVYRIIQVNEDGHATELSWPQVKSRCGELGLDYVPEITRLSVTTEEELTNLNLAVEHFTNGLGDEVRFSSLAPHLKEGVVVRFESFEGGDPVVLKSKSRVFGLLEGYLRENDDYVDLEETS